MAAVGIEWHREAEHALDRSCGLIPTNSFWTASTLSALGAQVAVRAARPLLATIESPTTTALQ